MLFQQFARCPSAVTKWVMKRNESVPIQLTELADFHDADNNVLTVGDNVKFTKSKLVFKEKTSVVVVGKDVKISECQIEIGRNAALTIGDGVTISGKITVGLNSRIHIGSGLSVTGNIVLRAVESTTIDIGDDCLFGSDIIIRTSDGHPVYDAATGERINLSRSITIGRHVWIADRAVILKGADIGDASIVGVGSVLTRPIGKNCVAAGNPAKVVRTGITWERSPSLRTEEFYFAVEGAFSA